MSSPLRALVWEQARVAGVLLLGLYAALSLVSLTMLIPTRFGQYFHFDLVKDLERITALGLSAAVVLSLMRLDANGHMAWRFAPHLVRLPVTTPRLVLIPFGVRCALLALLVIVLSAQYWLMTGATLHSTVVWLPLAAYPVLQALIWGIAGLPGPTYGVSGLVLAAVGLWRIGMPDATLGALLARVVDAAASPLAAGAAVILAGAYAVVGVGLARRGERFGPPTPQVLWERFLDRRPRQRRRHTSPLAAQCWFEWRCVGLYIPIGTLVGGLLLQGIAMALLVGSPAYYDATLLHYAPYAALVASIFLAALLMSRSRAGSGHARYEFLRPASDTMLAQAYVLVFARSLTYGLAIAFVLSTAAWIIVPSETGAFLLQAYAEGQVSGLEIAGTIARPFLWSALLGWFAVAASLSIATMATVGISVLVTMIVYGDHFLEVWGVSGRVLAYAFIALTLAAFVGEGWFAWSKNFVSARTLAFTAACVPALAWVLWANTYLMERAHYGSFLVLAVALLCPVVGASWTIARMRKH